MVLDIDYDTNGNDTVAKLNQGGSIINFQAFGEEAKLTDGNGNQKTFTHNADGNVMTITEGGYTTNFTYIKKGDINQGLLEKVIYPRKNFTQYTYKGETNLVQYVTENPGPIEIEPQEESQRKTDFIYEDFSPNLKSIVYPGGLTQHYSYNDYGQLTSEDNETWNNWDNYTYDKRGNLDTLISSDGINSIYEVNDYDEILHETITSNFKESLSPLSYHEKTGKAKKLFFFI